MARLVPSGPPHCAELFYLGISVWRRAGNVIHWITVESQGGVMPYVFTQPVVQIFSASLQAVIGWIFALYVSWWLAEAGAGSDTRA